MQQIRYFLSLSTTLNFTRAAEECNVSQPALTRAIQALEGELGGELIRREGRLSHLTELGQRMLPLMERCYDSAVTAKDVARAVTKNEVAPLSLAVSHSVNIEMFMPPIAELFHGFPGIQMRITHGSGEEVLNRLKEGGAELALAGPVDMSWERLDQWPLKTEGFELAMHANHPLAKENSVDGDKLHGHPIFAQVGCECRKILTDWFDDQNIAFVVSHEVDTHHDMNALLTASSGIALVPKSAPHASQLKRAVLNGLELTRTISAYAVAGRARSPSASAFLNLLRSADFSAAAA